MELATLERGPPANYFDGCKRRTPKKKVKPPKQKNVIPLDPKGPPPSSNEDWKSVLGEGRPKEKKHNEMEEKLEKKRMQQKIKCFEIMRQHQQDKTFKKQRLAEKQCLEQQENLVETWLEIIKRRSQVRNCPTNCWDQSRPSYRYNEIVISLSSKRFWSDGEGTTRPVVNRGCRMKRNSKANEPSQREKDNKEVEKPGSSPRKDAFVEDLCDGLDSKLVFVDVDSGDESDRQT